MMGEVGSVLQPIHDFLPCLTPANWVLCAIEKQATLLIDHANCERKAAAAAISVMHRYTNEPALILKMSKLAREELRHFEQVFNILRMRGIDYVALSGSRYAPRLHSLIRRSEPGRLIDTLIVGALIEARSCERFAVLAPKLDAELSRFYQSLLKSEARHFLDYLDSARLLCGEDELEERLHVFRTLEQTLVLAQDSELRFHSGPSY